MPLNLKRQVFAVRLPGPSSLIRSSTANSSFPTTQRRKHGSRQRTWTLALIALSVAVGLSVSNAPATQSPEFAGKQDARVVGLATLTPALSHAAAGSIADIPWSEHVFTTPSGESVDVSVSTAYPDADEIGSHWADFFASLLHGRELDLLKVYVAPLDQVQMVCGTIAVGCYGDDQLLLVNETALGFAPEEVARHEYGHHIASHRLDTPWPAVDWGPKRWATAAGICSRVRSRNAYPGDESLLYRLNPGEAFAETYRVLIDTRLGQTQPSWPLVDASFYPDQTELDAAEQDVVAPWTGPTTRVVRARLDRRSDWQQRVATPLDGTITLTLTAPNTDGARILLLARDGHTVLEASRPSRTGRATVTTRVCGERSVILRVSAQAAPGRHIEVRITLP